VYEAVTSTEFETIYQKFRSDGWRPDVSEATAFKVSRENVYQGAIINFVNPMAPDGKGANYVHLVGDVPEEVDHKKFGHVGERIDSITIQNKKVHSTEEHDFVPEGRGSLSVNTESHDAKEIVQQSQVSTQDETGPGGGGGGGNCTIQYEDCTVGWNCAMTIVFTGVGVIGCAVGIVASGGLALVFCLGDLWGIYNSWKCINETDCSVSYNTVTRSEYRRWKNNNEGVTADTYQEFCNKWT